MKRLYVATVLTIGLFAPAFAQQRDTLMARQDILLDLSQRRAALIAEINKVDGQISAFQVMTADSLRVDLGIVSAPDTLKPPKTR